MAKTESQTDRQRQIGQKLDALMHNNKTNKTTWHYFNRQRLQVTMAFTITFGPFHTWLMSLSLAVK